MRRTWVAAHRWLGLVAAAFWLIQAATGVAIVFRWELDDAMIAGEPVVPQLGALGSRVESIVRDRGTVSSLWASSAAASRFDIYYADAAGIDRVMRVDGAGRILRDGPDHALIANGGLFNTLTTLHQSLFAGDLGDWIVGLSGILLLTNLLLGLRVAWPHARSWRKTLFDLPTGRAPARLHGWHRTIGFWGSVPAVMLISAGILLAFKDGIAERLAADLPVPEAHAASAAAGTPAKLSPGTALEIAMHRYPGAALSALILPADTEPWYLVRLRVPGELPRNWGTTTLFVDAKSGAVIGNHDARRAPPGRAFVDALYPVHTGQWAGIAGRAVVLVAGAWLLTMVVLGLTLWFMRRSRA